MNHPEKVFLSWRCLSTTRHNSTQTNYIKLQVDKAEWGDVGASASDFPPPICPVPCQLKPEIELIPRAVKSAFAHLS